MGSWGSMPGRSLLSSICWWYGIDKVFEEIDELLELALLVRVGFSLIMSMSMSILDGIWVIVEFEVIADEERKCLFIISLIDATIQDRGKRERSVCDVMLVFNP